MPEDTLFDKILAGEIPSEAVYEDEYVYAFKDINPQAPVHVLVIPRIRSSSLADLKNEKAEDVGRFIQGVSRVADHLGLEKSGYRVVFNTGKDGLQTVAYTHAHILGGRRMKWPPG